MSDDVKLSHTSALILRTVGAGYRYGFDIMDARLAEAFGSFTLDPPNPGGRTTERLTRLCAGRRPAVGQCRRAAAFACGHCNSGSNLAQTSQ